MTLTSPASVGFAVAGGAPADARQWITVDLAGFPGAGRRGYIVATEPVARAWHSIELANQSREIILTELRRLRHLPADEALGRACAAANGVVFGKNRDMSFASDAEEPSLIGVMALVFEDQSATIAYLPPGQLMLVEDGLTYTVPDFASWFPDYQQAESPASQAEPLGYASWTAPLMAQTEVRAGDTIILCTSRTGRAYIEDVVESGHSLDDLSWFHHRDPDAVLDTFREVVIDRDLPSAAAAVVGFPPLPNTAQIQTLGDVGRRLKDSWRHGTAMTRQLKPARNPGRALGTAASPAAARGARNGPQPQRPRRQPRVDRAIHRLQGALEPAPGKGAGWRRPTPAAEYGVIGTHGVDVFRGQSHYMGDPSWRHNLPRLPIIGAAWIWPLLLMIVAGIVLGGLWIREEYLVPDVDVEAAVASIDRRIVGAQDATGNDAIVAELTTAQREIDAARDLGVADDVLNQRQQAVTELLDDATNVIRMSDAQRIGSLPEEFGEARVQGVYTPAGVFFVAGSLYQYRPNPEGASPELVTILSEGESIAGTPVGSLWGVAFDVQGLYVTDGMTVFMLPVESQEWQAVPLGRINDQEWTPGPIAAFDGSIYLLQAQYRQIYRFTIDSAEGEAVPRDWLLTGARDRIESASDVAIFDGRVYILLDDGTIQQMYLGDLDEEVEPSYIEPDTAVALVGQVGSGYLYEAVEDEAGDDGRIVAFDLEGGNAAQLRLPMGISTGDANVLAPFDGVQDVIVDESTGTVYIINADGIWTARYSLPPLPEAPNGESTDDPAATPVASG